MQIQTIPLVNLVIAFIPVVIGLFILQRWSISPKRALYGVLRMLIQLLLIGYALAYIFESESAALISAILFVMVIASSWIALGSIERGRKKLLFYAFLSILLGGGSVLLLVILGVLELDPWYLPHYTIPLAGMIFSNSMNTVSLAVERLFAELDRGIAFIEARNIAFQTAMIPVINSLFAVGLVSLPGMMTGQILSGVSPLIAVRYQIMVMCMIFGSSAITAIIFLVMSKKAVEK